MLYLPGTILHELAHFLGALIFARNGITSIFRSGSTVASLVNLIKFYWTRPSITITPVEENGVIAPGSVSYSSKKDAAHMLISFMPKF